MLEITSIGFDERTGQISAMKGRFVLSNHRRFV